MSKAKALIWLRLATAGAILFAITWQVEDRIVNNVFHPQEYFSYFTIITSLFTAAVLIGSGVGLLRGNLSSNNSLDSLRWLKLRLTVTAAYVIVAVVYNLLLRNQPPAAEDGNYQWPTAPNEILHVYAPIIVLLDFILSDSLERLRWSEVLGVLIYPIVWLVLTVIRGSIFGWWPYWFLDPTDKGGIPQMLMYTAIITAFFAIVGYGLLAVQRSLAGRRVAVSVETEAE
jgi:hypothetical protein